MPESDCQLSSFLISEVEQGSILSGLEKSLCIATESAIEFRMKELWPGDGFQLERSLFCRLWAEVAIVGLIKGALQIASCFQPLGFTRVQGRR